MGREMHPRPTPWQLAADVALAAGCAAISATVLTSPPFRHELPPLAWALAMLHASALALRRVAPRWAAAASIAAGAAYLTQGFPMVGLGIVGLVVVYSLAAHLAWQQSLAGLAAGELAMVASLGAAGTLPSGGTLAGNTLALAAAWLLGDAARRRWRLTLLYRERAEELEAAQTELARRAVVEERLRIARELHDVVAHSMSVIAVQAGTARMVLPEGATEAKAAIEAIEASSRSALQEMRRLLGVLRDPSELSTVAPLPTLADLDALVTEAAEEGGITVDVRVEGERIPLAPGMELAAYRIVQEGLTNVRRHAPGATAVVRVTFGRRELTVTVQNALTGGQAAPGGSGLGVTGMRERAAVYGGTVEAGAVDGTFSVVARLPYDESPR